MLDETTIGHLGLPDEPGVLYIVVRRGPSGVDELWETEVRCLLSAEYPPHVARLTILAAELGLLPTVKAN